MVLAVVGVVLAGTPQLADGVEVAVAVYVRGGGQVPSEVGPTIFGAVAAAGLVVWLLLRPPQNLPVLTLPKYVGFEANIEQGSPLDCKTPGCLLVVLGTDVRTQGAIPSAVEMARSLEEKGVETTFVVTGAELDECARAARLFRRPVLLDPHGDLLKALNVPHPPCWVVHTPTGRIRHLGEEPMTEGEVLRAAGV